MLARPRDNDKSGAHSIDIRLVRMLTMVQCDPLPFMIYDAFDEIEM